MACHTCRVAMSVGRRRAADLVCGTAIVVCQGWSALSSVLVPGWLGTRPVLLELLNGSFLSFAAAGAFVRVGHASLAAALLAPLALSLPFDVVSWWAGHHFGPTAADWLVRHRPASKRAIERSERLIDRYGIFSVMLAPWLPLPTALIYAANGWRRLPLPVFLAADAAGTFLRAAVVLLIGYTSGEAAVRVIRAVSGYSAWLTGAVVVCLLCIVFLQARTLRGGGAGRGPG
jgi:membrane-associated protein